MLALTLDYIKIQFKKKWGKKNTLQKKHKGLQTKKSQFPNTFLPSSEFFFKKKHEININLALIKPGIDPEYSSRQKKKISKGG